ncbi:helix-turn-helix domain-containing protein [Micromonospora sp. WMMC241]|uniref:AraC family transcriptional regulator n=1 Tax=Micromonospora sp. WMMC241 TaxID=3015159 RepID=UPI0022B74C7F|nr:AraC family transcriptional regulator [Micromonospora sp. WMMC241]MCZ7434825.1 helix-turn-helix domain-containing protein [Micromonospora sp. WMMC241]
MAGSASNPAGSPRPIRFVSSEPDDAREFIGRMYDSHLRVGDAVNGGMWVGFDRLEFGDVNLSAVRIAADLDFRMEGGDQVLIATVKAGRVAYARGRDSARYGPGDTYIGSRAEVRWDARLHGPDLDVVGLPEALLHEVAGTAPDRPGGRWRPRSWEPLPGCAGQWHATARYVRELLEQPHTATEPLILGAAVRMLAATALTIFPGDVPAGPSAGDRRDAHPATLRRAIAFIEANPDVDLGVADIARAAAVTVRALRLAFRRHLDTTPLAYLHRVRLDKAREDLRRATDGDDGTVTSIANRWGFADPSRFAERYRDEYGEAPGRTLRD